MAAWGVSAWLAEMLPIGLIVMALMASLEDMTMQLS